MGKSSIEDELNEQSNDQTELLNNATNINHPPTLQQQPSHFWSSSTAIDRSNNNDNNGQSNNDTFPSKIITRLKKSYKHIRQLDRRQLLEYAIQWKWLLLFFLFSFIMGFIMWIFRKELLDGLEKLSNMVKDMGTSGYLLISLLIFLSAFPPMIGYGTLQTLSGFTFGFEKGYPISYFSALFGAVTCFIVARKWLKKWVQHTMAKYPNLEAVVKAVEKRGFKLFVLIRLSPYPFNLLNVMFAATEIPLSHFVFGTALSLIKIGLHVYIGANLTSFAKHVLGDEEGLSESEKRVETIREIAIVVGSILATCVMMYVYFVAKEAIKEVQQQSDEQMAFLGPDIENQIAMEEAAEAVGVSDDWIEWNESDEEEIHSNDNHDNNNIDINKKHH
ncbi:unnamed protein product [Cunninghamella blakesleeana]